MNRWNLVFNSVRSVTSLLVVQSDFPLISISGTRFLHPDSSHKLVSNSFQQCLKPLLKEFS